MELPTLPKHRRNAVQRTEPTTYTPTHLAFPLPELIDPDRYDSFHNFGVTR